MDERDNGMYGGSRSLVGHGIVASVACMNGYIQALHTSGTADDHNVHKNHVGHNTLVL